MIKVIRCKSYDNGEDKIPTKKSTNAKLPTIIEYQPSIGIPDNDFVVNSFVRCDNPFLVVGGADT